MTPPTTPRRFDQRAAEHPRVHDEAMPPGAVTEAMVRAIATWINRACQRAEAHACARQRGEAEAATADAGFNPAERDLLLDPGGDLAQRQAVFRRVLHAARTHPQLEGVDPALLHDERGLQVLWEATCAWGEHVQALLDDASITTIMIIGTTVLGVGPQRRVIQPQAYASAREPLLRATFLTRARGRIWDAENPIITGAWPGTLQLHLVREPCVMAMRPAEPGLLVVMRRRHRPSATLPALVDRGMLDAPAAALLALLLDAGASCLVSGPPEAATMEVLDALVDYGHGAPGQHVLVVDRRARAVGGPTPLPAQEPDEPPSPGCMQVARPTVLPALAALRPDLVVLPTLDDADAGEVLHHAEAGQRMLVRINAASAPAALRRMARLAATAAAGTRFAGAPDAALHALSAAFDVVIEVASAQPRNRPCIQTVALLAEGSAFEQAPRLVPLLTATVTADAITWAARAEVQGGRLVWRDAPLACSARIQAWVGAPSDRQEDQIADASPPESQGYEPRADHRRAGATTPEREPSLGLTDDHRGVSHRRAVEVTPEREPSPGLTDDERKDDHRQAVAVTSEHEPAPELQDNHHGVFHRRAVATTPEREPSPGLTNDERKADHRRAVAVTPAHEPAPGLTHDEGRADLPQGGPTSPARAPAPPDDDLLHRARAALRVGAWDEAAGVLTRALHTSDPAQVQAVIAQALQMPELVAPLDQALDEAAARLQAALAAWELDRAQQLSVVPSANVLVMRRRATHPGWQAALAALTQRQITLTTCQTALTQASAHRQRGDLVRAVEVLQPIAVEALPPDLARTLLTARRSLLTQVIAQAQADVPAPLRDVEALAQVNRDLAAQQAALTQPAPAPGERSVPQARPDGPKLRDEPPAPSGPVATPPPPAVPVAGDAPVLVTPTERSGWLEAALAQRPPTSSALPPAASTVDDDRGPVSPTERSGWLEAALAFSRERTRLRQADATQADATEGQDAA
ncbi:hypothetical protein [Candidatus Chloroploca asiatica]|uniref:Bacterial type II secretion system protein E domain-containing protein n=1 Tax=Candidatus Chloroploca asiatica TaxID=1506545 RepID=A0A2H3KFP6_9CHLR|nr:hypothetical protein [Candidatus Chloroploca asiatica]PDV96514.1 hypothetical protein A9Q02_20700 [Candidatus Chloroploca asiatica]